MDTSLLRGEGMARDPDSTAIAHWYQCLVTQDVTGQGTALHSAGTRATLLLLSLLDNGERGVVALEQGGEFRAPIN